MCPPSCDQPRVENSEDGEGPGFWKVCFSLQGQKSWQFINNKCFLIDCFLVNKL